MASSVCERHSSCLAGQLLVLILVFHQIHCHILYGICRSVGNGTGGVDIPQWSSLSLPLLGHCCHGIQEDGNHSVVEVASSIEGLYVHSRSCSSLSSVAIQYFLQNRQIPFRHLDLLAVTCAMSGSPSGSASSITQVRRGRSIKAFSVTVVVFNE